MRIASTLFRTCARLLPRSYRERFGWESEDTFTALVTETLERQGSRAAMTTAAAACGDIARTGVVERTSGWAGAVGSGLTGDLAQSLRIFRREPILAGAITLILALVAGPTLAIVSTLYAMLLAPLPYLDADRLVVVYQGTNPYLRAAKVSDYRAANVFASVGGVRPLGHIVAIDGPPERVSGFQVTGRLMTELGVPLAAGRDMDRGELGVALVTRGFALSRFGSAEAAVGRRITLNYRPATIVGVLGLRPTLPASMVPVDVFSPHDVADAANPTRRHSQAIVIARLAPGVSREVATQKIRAADALAQQQFGDPAVTSDLMSMHHAIAGPIRVPLMILFAAIAVVFAIGAVSVASLVLARAAARASDVAVRRALGASRYRLARAWVVDGMTLAVPGIALGAWIAELLHGYVQRQLPAGLTIIDKAGLGTTMILAAALAALTTLLFGLAPIGLGLFRAASLGWQRTATFTAALRHRWSQVVLISVQVAISVVLVSSAIWLSASLWRVLSRPVGFDPSNMIFVSVRSAQPPAAVFAQGLQLQERLKQDDATGGGVAMASGLPAVNSVSFGPQRIRADGPILPEAERPSIARLAVSPNYFHTVGIRLVEGRYLTEQDNQTPHRVIVLSRSFAARWFPDGALGRTVAFGTSDRREVVGIVEDVHSGRLMRDSSPQCYTPVTDFELGAPSHIVVRTERPVETVRATVSTMMRALDPNARVDVIQADTAITTPLLPQTIATRLTIGLAGLVLLLAVVNIYALSAFAVVQRKREIGIRVALGASASQAMRLVMRRAMAWAGGGLCVGALATVFLAAPLAQGFLYKVAPNEPALLVAAFATVAVVAMIASWLPARRASRIDPALTLRAE
jgi:putative ABC transport system permease protein